ncbi:MAG: ABC transporter permease [Propionibacteriaceae bacterium]|jgi:putative spermidine/putrescine transport system permease protein|nr:ABC transporter permease [Propionibacteriaceae bacterium]
MPDTLERPSTVPGGQGAASAEFLTSAPAAPRSSLRHRLADRGVEPSLLLVAPALVFVLVLFIYPFLYGVGLSFQPASGGIGLESYRDFFTDPYEFGTIWKTMRLALPAALFNVIASIPIAYKLRGRFKGKRLLATMLVVPISLGTVLVAEGLLNFAGRAGWINRFLLAIGVIDTPIALVNNYWGVLFSLIITGFPFAFLLISSYLSGIDPSLERAAALMGAGWGKRFTKIILPLLAPGLATTFMLTFVLAFSVFPSATLVGDPAGATRVISLAAYQAYAEQFNYSKASAIAIVMGVVELAVLAVVMLWRSTLYRGSTGGKG